MKKSNFEEKVLEFMSNMNEFVKEQKEFNKEIKSRLDVLEQDIQAIKNCPTIKTELKND